LRSALAPARLGSADLIGPVHGEGVGGLDSPSGAKRCSAELCLLPCHLPSSPPSFSPVLLPFFDGHFSCCIRLISAKQTHITSSHLHRAFQTQINLDSQCYVLRPLSFSDPFIKSFFPCPYSTPPSFIDIYLSLPPAVNLFLSHRSRFPTSRPP